MPRLTPQQIDSIPDLYKSGLSTYKIAEKLNCNNVTIWNYIKKAWIQTKPQWWGHLKGKTILTPLEILKTQQLYEQWISSIEIAKHINCSSSTILKTLKNINVEIRKPSRYNKGKTTLNVLIRTTTQVREWKRHILKRDGFTCVHCWKKGWDLEVDHIVPLSKIIEDNHITKEDYMVNIEKFLDINNWRTLCIECHKKTPTHGWKSRLKSNTIQ